MGLGVQEIFPAYCQKYRIAQINLRQHLNTGQLSKPLPSNTATPLSRWPLFTLS
jgi:hypothetical protein